MILKNNPIETSKSGILSLFIVPSIFVSLSIYAYNSQNPFYILGVVVAVVIYFFLFILIKYNNNYVKHLQEHLKLQYINFHNNVIDFNFINTQDNFTCTHEDITKVELDIETVKSRKGYETFFQQLNIIITVFDKTYILHQTDGNPLEIIYNAIECFRGVKEIIITFSGDGGVIEDINEKAHTYLKTGYKKQIGKSTRIGLIILSFFLFTITIACFIGFKDYLNDLLTYCYGLENILVPLIFLLSLIITAFIFDILVIKEQIKDIKNLLIMSNSVNSWYLIIIKVIIILLVIYFYFPSLFSGINKCLAS